MSGTPAVPASSAPRIAIVDDDESVLASLDHLLRRRGWDVRCHRDPQSLLADLDEADLVLQDMNFSRSTEGREGLELLERIRARRPEVPVALLTAWGSIELAVEGMRRGANDFLTKPWDNEHLERSLATLLELSRRPVEASPERRRLQARAELDGLLGEDPAFLRALDLLVRVADTNASVLLQGESGTGKELFAEALHRNSSRRGGPLIKVNLGGIASNLFESEMFGHVPGAFTDAKTRRRGRLELADGGTIFLDEIGDLDSRAQVKLLRVLQDRRFEVLGSSESRSVDVRVVSATHRDLERDVGEGRFREDLLFRLNLIVIRIPALRQRSSDIPRLAGHFVQEFARRYDREAPELADDALAWLRGHPWPGNVRQLRQMLERAMLVVDRGRWTAADLDRVLATAGAASGGSASGDLDLEALERQAIEKALQRFSGNLTRAAEALGISRPALYRRLEKYGLARPDDG